MKNDVKEIIIEDRKNGTTYNGKIIYPENSEIFIKLYEKSSVIKRLKYIGENTECDTLNTTYKQVL